jgi:hypothetical protein
LELDEIYNRQDRLRKQIEDYEGDDWDLLYGVTGLWRKVCADEAKTLLFKGQVDYFAGLASKQQDRVRILGDIIRRCKANGDKWGPAGNLLMAKTLELAGQKQAASKALGPIYSSKNLSDAVYFRTEILKNRLSGINSTELLKKLFQQAGAHCGDDFELHLRLAFLALRLGETDLLEKVIEKWPESEDLVGSAILSEMQYQQAGGRLTEEALLQKSVFEITLAVKAARRRRVEQYKELLEAICGKKKFQTGLVFYVAAQSYTESSPALAVEYYLRAVRAQQRQRSDELEIGAVQIAKQGAQLAHRVYYEEPAGQRIAREMIDYYCEIAGERVDETIQYLYSRLLKDEGRSSEAAELLRKISQGKGKYSKQARLDLIVGELKNDSEDRAVRYKMIKKLEELIASGGSQGEQDRLARAEATDLCCQLLLEEDGDKSARKVIELVGEAKGLDVQRSAILKAGALLRLERLPDAVSELVTVVKPKGCELAERGMEVLSAVLAEDIDECTEEMVDFAEYIDNCDRLARYCLGCAEGEWWPAAGLICAEFGVLVAGDDREKLGEAEEILIKLMGQGYDNDIDWLRCNARLLKAKGEFAAAGGAWGRVRAATRAAGASQKQGRRWWRAKFYEIQCWGKLGDTTGADVAHAVEVLESSFSDIPRFWAAKLEGLKDGANR